jgi:hypothetical protein
VEDTETDEDELEEELEPSKTSFSILLSFWINIWSWVDTFIILTLSI